MCNTLHDIMFVNAQIDTSKKNPFEKLTPAYFSLMVEI